MTDIFSHNRNAWDMMVADGSRWTVAVSAEEIARARRGNWSVILTPKKPVPVEWFDGLQGKNVLALASGGGQQGPIFAAAGAHVTVFDASPAQLERDRHVAARDGLPLETAEGDMADLSRFADASFDLIFHPCSNSFVPELGPVWREAARVLKPGGRLLSGFCQPVLYLVDENADERGEIVVRHRIPYSDLSQLTPAEVQAKKDSGKPLDFGHTLEDQIGGQLRAGLVIVGFYEDSWAPGISAISDRIPCFAATLAIKPFPPVVSSRS